MLTATFEAFVAIGYPGYFVFDAVWPSFYYSPVADGKQQLTFAAKPRGSGMELGIESCARAHTPSDPQLQMGVVSVGTSSWG